MFNSLFNDYDRSLTFFIKKLEKCDTIPMIMAEEPKNNGWWYQRMALKNARLIPSSSKKCTKRVK